MISAGLGSKRRGGSRPPRVLPTLLAVCFAAGSSWGCVTVAEHRKLERRLSSMQRSTGAGQARQQLADLTSEIDDLRTEIRELNGRLEESERMARDALDEARKARREAAAGGGGGASTSGEDRPQAAGAILRAEEDAELSDELKAYQEGVSAWRSKDYTTCIDRFRGFLQTYASSSRADDAAFWIADCHYKQGEFKNAVLRFDDVVRNYPTGNRAPDALYRQGESLLKLGPGFHEAARRAFERVLKEYPDSARAAQAKRQLEAYAAG